MTSVEKEKAGKECDSGVDRSEQNVKSLWDEMAERQFAAGYEFGQKIGLKRAERRARERAAMGMILRGDIALDEIAQYTKLPLAKVKLLADKQFETGFKWGTEQGEQNALESVALRMIQDGYVLFGSIAKYTGLSVYTVKEIADSLA